MKDRTREVMRESVELDGAGLPFGVDELIAAKARRGAVLSNRADGALT